MKTSNSIKSSLVMDQANISRMYDYWLGGYHNFEVDRRKCFRLQQTFPELPQLIRTYRDFLERTVEYIIGKGITQILDIGSGLTNGYGLYQIVNTIDPSVKVVYVDNDPVTISHCQYSFEGKPGARAYLANTVNPYQVINNAGLVNFFDFRRPLAIIMLGYLERIVCYDQVCRIIRTFSQIIAPGSLIVFSHLNIEDLDVETRQKCRGYRRHSPQSVCWRSRARIRGIFRNLRLISPGLVCMPRWRHDGFEDLPPELERTCPILAGVACREGR